MPWNSGNRRIAFVAFLSLLVFAVGCEDNSDNDNPTTVVPTNQPDVNELIEDVSSEGSVGTYVDATLPTGSMPAPQILGSRQYVTGGSVVLQVTPSDTATELLISADPTDTGYYTIPLPGATARAEVSKSSNPMWQSKMGRPKLTIAYDHADPKRLAPSVLMTITPAADTPRSSFNILIAESDGTNNSNAAVHNVFENTTAAGSNLLQASLNWSHPVDLDIHVETPEGDDIYWANRTGPNGGQLDLDSNAGCSIDGINNENITWSSTAPTAGNYVVRLNLWSACNEPGPFPYVITTTVNGNSEVFVGEMTLADEMAGGALAGTVITTLTVGQPAK